jgi:hypothetical protein
MLKRLSVLKLLPVVLLVALIVGEPASSHGPNEATNRSTSAQELSRPAPPPIIATASGTGQANGATDGTTGI